jgi:dTMP kinase
MNKGMLITFEGNDGSGKTTQIIRLSDYLKEKGLDVAMLREPGGTPIGEKIRSLLLDNENRGMCAATEMMLYAASRAQLVATVINPTIESGGVVICDRFVDSSLAYQGYGRGLGCEAVWAVNNLAIGGRLPDITFFMDIDADTAMDRRNAKGEAADRIENEEMNFHRRVYNGYIELSKAYPERIRRIVAGRSPDEVFREIRMHVDALLNRI